jgi:hypothetical protein
MSLEYLRAFHKFVSSHPHIYGAVKEEIHKRARGSAGGQAKAKRALEGGGEEIDLEEMLSHPPDESPVKATNAAHVEGEIIETDQYFDVPTVFTREGVWTGTNGIPTLKTFDALKASAPWFVGAPITPKHIETDTIRPDDRRLGHVISATAREDKRDIFGVGRYFKSLLNEDEIHKLQNKQNLDGSPGYFTPVRSEAGNFGGKDYQATEIGPYVVTEYATFFDGTRGACDSASGCGPFQNAVDELLAEPPSLMLVDGNVRKCPKKSNGANKMTEELVKKLNSATDEIIFLKAELEKLKNAAPVDIKPLEEKIAAFETKFENAAKIESETKIATEKVAFGKLLNAAAATDSDALYTAYKADPVGWLSGNKDKLLNEAEAKDPAGKKHADASGGFDLKAEQAKLWGYN